MTADAPQPKCPSCSGQKLRRIGALHDVALFAGKELERTLPPSSLHSCLDCRLKFRLPVLPASRYEALYDNDLLTAWPDAPSERTDWLIVAEYLDRHADAGASVLDFGCYTGGLLARLGPRYARFGVELNAQARKTARDRTGVDVFPGLDAIEPGRQFDFVTVVDVVEHFADPGRVLESLMRLTRKGGTLLVTTGDADAFLWKLAGARWWYCSLPEHLAFISERWVREWLSRSSTRAALVEVRKFRHVRLAAPVYIRHACMALLYFLAPRSYMRVIGALKRRLGRGTIRLPAGMGLSKDHLFLAIRRE